GDVGRSAGGAGPVGARCQALPAGERAGHAGLSGRLRHPRHAGLGVPAPRYRGSAQLTGTTRYPLASALATLGSAVACDIRVMLPSVCPHHATVAVHNSQVTRAARWRAGWPRWARRSPATSASWCPPCSRTTLPWQCTTHSALATLGSAVSCGIRVMLPSVCPHHATVAVHNSQTVVRNMGDGETLVNGESVSVAVLQHGDVITLGDRSLRWEYSAPSKRQQPALVLPSLPTLRVTSGRGARGVRRGSAGGVVAPRDRALQLAIEMTHRASMPAARRSQPDLDSSVESDADKRKSRVSPKTGTVWRPAVNPPRSGPQAARRPQPDLDSSVESDADTRKARVSPKTGTVWRPAVNPPRSGPQAARRSQPDLDSCVESNADKRKSRVSPKTSTVWRPAVNPPRSGPQAARRSQPDLDSCVESDADKRKSRVSPKTGTVWRPAVNPPRSGPQAARRSQPDLDSSVESDAGKRKSRVSPKTGTVWRPAVNPPRSGPQAARRSQPNLDSFVESDADKRKSRVSPKTGTVWRPAVNPPRSGNVNFRLVDAGSLLVTGRKAQAAAQVAQSARRTLSAKKSTPLRLAVLKKAQSAHKLRV
ncbi:putative golgin IMH1, partial [Operophtera brumata]